MTFMPSVYRTSLIRFFVELITLEPFAMRLSVVTGKGVVVQSDPFAELMFLGGGRGM